MNDLGPTQIVDLPTEVLSQIFLNLTDNSDRLSVRDVCATWRSVVDTTVGVQKCAGEENVWQDGRQMEPLTVLGTTGISDCTFGNIFSTTRPADACPLYLLPNLMKSVTFDGVISRAMYPHLTNPLQNLTSLTFHISTLAHIEVKLHKSALPRSITSLSLTTSGGIGVREENLPYGSEETLLKNVCSICDTDFPKLRRFDVTLPYLLVSDYGFDLFPQVKNFLSQCRRHDKLETFNICLQTMNSRDSNNGELYDVFRAGLRREKDTEIMRLDNWKEVDTVNFGIHDLDMDCVSAFRISRRIIAGEKLESMSIISTSLSSFSRWLIRMMQRSWETLTEVRLNIKYTGRIGAVNCSIFSACTVLKTLVLNKTDECGRGRYRDPTLRNVSSLPLSLKTLELRNFLMDTPSVDYVSKSLRLETLVLNGIGSKDNHGMSIPTLLWILKESPTITALQIEGLNESCRLSSLAFTWGGLIWPPTCQVCIVAHQTQFWKSPPPSVENGAVGIKDKELLNSLFSTRSRRYIPLIQKRNGVWAWRI